MNIHMKEYIPRYIDFGNVQINTTETKELLLKNIITVPFEFEFVPIKSCPGIVIEPLVGEINPLSNKTINIKSIPTAYGLSIAEYEFRLSEFDYEPVLISISSSCNVYDKVLNENIIKHMKKLKENPNTSNYSIDLKLNDSMKKNNKLNNVLNEV